MEIIPIFTQGTVADSWLGALQGVVAACGMLLAWRLVRRAAARVRSLPLQIGSVTPPALSLGALATLTSAVPVTASTIRSNLTSDSVQTSPALDERVPPPRSLVRAGVMNVPGGHTGTRVHAAIHRGSTERVTAPLFARIAGNDTGERPHLQPWERGALDLRRTAKQEQRPTSHTETPSHYAVMPGDTLWDIAARILATDDQRAIARYWPKIHRENREVIGRNPNLLRPGQVLALPRRDQA